MERGMKEVQHNLPKNMSKSIKIISQNVSAFDAIVISTQTTILITFVEISTDQTHIRSKEKPFILT